MRIRIALPGISPEDVEVHVAGRTLHVRAVEKDGNTLVSRYDEIVTLPESVDPEKVSASFRHGLLELSLPFMEAIKPRRIEIAAEAPKQLSAA